MKSCPPAVGRPKGRGDPHVSTIKACRAFHYRRVTSSEVLRRKGAQDSGTVVPGPVVEVVLVAADLDLAPHQDRSDDRNERETPRSGAGQHDREATLPPRHRHPAWGGAPARVVELADTADSKSAAPRACGFKSRPGYSMGTSTRPAGLLSIPARHHGDRWLPLATGRNMVPARLLRRGRGGLGAD